jgi:hypothetical protein
LAAMAVMNMADDTVVVWKQVFITYAPIFLAVPLSGSEPQARHSAYKRNNTSGIHCNSVSDIRVWQKVFITYAPILLAVPLSGSEPQARHSAYRTKVTGNLTLQQHE